MLIQYITVTVLFFLETWARNNKQSNYFTYSNLYTKPKYTQEGTAAAYVMYLSLEAEGNPTKRNTILLGEATWMKPLLKYVLVDYFHNFRCGLEHCMAFYGMWLNNFITYQKMFYLFSRVCCYQSVCQLSLLFFWEREK